MLDVTKEERIPERKPFLKFGVSAILGLEQSADEEDERSGAEGIRTPPEERKTLLKSTAVMLAFDKDVFSDYSVSSGGGSGAGSVGGGNGSGGGESSASAVKTNGHPYLHSYFHPLIHASATKPMSYASKSNFIQFLPNFANFCQFLPFFLVNLSPNELYNK